MGKTKSKSKSLIDGDKPIGLTVHVGVFDGSTRLQKEWMISMESLFAMNGLLKLYNQWKDRKSSRQSSSDTDNSGSKSSS